MAARNYIELVDKTMRVLQTLAAAKGPMLLKDIASQTRIVKSSAFRILFTLKELGYVEQAGRNGDYRLTLKMLPLARSATPRATLVNIARPHLNRLRSELQESVWLAQRQGSAIVIVDSALTPHRIKLAFDVGDLCPIHATAIGKCIAAFLGPQELDRLLSTTKLEGFTARTITNVDDLRAELARVRQARYALNDEETVDGVLLIGAPIFGAARRVCGALSVSVLADRCDSKRRSGLVQATRRCAEAISSDLQHLTLAAAG